MSSPVLAMVSTSSAASSSGANPLAAMLNGNGKISNGLFMSLINSNAAFKASANNGAIGNGASQLAKSGLAMDPTLLVLPHELANMSMDDLQALLANAGDESGDKLNDALLVALTPGTPAADAIADFLAKHSDKAQIINLSASTSQATDGTPSLTTDESAIPDNSSLLLIATGISPSDLEKLKETLKTLSDSSDAADDLATQISDAASDAAAQQAASDATNAAALTLVMLVPVALPQQAPQVSQDLGSDINLLSFSTLTTGAEDFADADLTTDGSMAAANHIKSAASSRGQYVSPFESDDLLGSAADMSDEEILAGLQKDGFQGSLSTLQKKSTSAAAETLSGKIDSSSLAGNGSVLTNGQTSIFAESSAVLASGQASSNTTNPLTDPVINNASAISAHPATQTVAMMVEKAAANGKSEQTLSIQLDPPELGRIQVQLSLEKGEAMKVRVLAEHKDTLELLQRDSHTLKASLEQAGIQTDGSSLSFDLAGGDQSFNQMLGGSQQDNSSGSNGNKFTLNASELGLSNDILEQVATTLSFIPDKVTGNVHYSLLV